uniref:LITAF domain-containing protein n=1 Tax=Panagrellus redivivus TaxID=6233 RepID=A0A7E4VXW0_PANRE
MEAMTQSMTLEGDIDVTLDDVPASVHVQPPTASSGAPQATATATVTAPAPAPAPSAAPAATNNNLSRPRRSCVSRAPSRASQRSVTFSLHTPSRNHESTYEESSQFNPAQLDTLSLGTRRNSQIHASQSNLSTNGAMLVYDQQHPGIRQGYPLGPFDPIPTMPGSVWYPMPPPPMPVYFCAPPQIDPKALRQAMKQAAKAEKLYQTKHQKPVSPCRQFCCGGFARILWIIIGIVLIGCIGIIIVSIAHI